MRKVKQIFNKIKKGRNQEGTATVIAVMIMSLLTGFVALAVSRTTNETLAMSNDISEARAFAAAQASLENMTLNTDAKFDAKLDIDSADQAEIIASVPDNFPNYEFNQTIRKTRTGEIVDATGVTFQGLKQVRDEWELQTTVTDVRTNVQSVVRRRFFNNRIPIFQFGVFGDDDVDFSSAPRFDFGGRVHANGNIFMNSVNGLYFASRITAQGEIITDTLPNGKVASTNTNGGEIFIKDGQLVFKRLKNTEGSALGQTVNGANLFATSTLPLPPTYANPNWNTVKTRFGTNVIEHADRLTLPLGSGTTSSSLERYIPLIKRGKSIGDVHNDGTGTVAAPSITPVTAASKDSVITTKERYYNKVGLRISLADSKAKLPGCYNVTAVCGVRLDGDAAGDGAEPTAGNARGYQPLAMNGGTLSTRLNGERFYIPGLQSWIKIELVANANAGAVVTTDVTKDILSLGVTKRAPSLGNDFSITSSYPADADTYSIINLQRFAIEGDQIKPGDKVSSEYMTYFNFGLNGKYNFVIVEDSLLPANINSIVPDKNPQSSWASSTARFACHSTPLTVAPFTSSCGSDAAAHWKTATIKTIQNRKVVPFPIMTFDTREGEPFENKTNSPTNTSATLNYTALFPNGKVPFNGVMSGIDINVGNLRLFLNNNATVKNLMPTTGTPYTDSGGGALEGDDVPNSNGWVVYASDRRGDFDFDGEYDMEDIFADALGNLNNNALTLGEDSNNNGVLEAEYVNEAPYFNESVSPDIAASVNTRFYRRAFRLTNGILLPGIFDTSNANTDTKGFTFASENGVYVIGNYNATGVSSYGTPTPSSNFIPQNNANHIPASIVADSNTILSNNWKDGNIFAHPFEPSFRTPVETTVRFGAIVGDNKNFYPCPNNTSTPGSEFPCYTGGVHNMNRFMESWSGIKLNYSGSLINLYNSHNNNGGFKCCGTVYTAPNRNFTFEETFLNPLRIPPGTPFIQSIKLTGFERVNE
jgi:Tfp pilus assembly protein PilX